VTESWLARDTGPAVVAGEEGAPESQRPSQSAAQLVMFVDEIERMLVREPLVGSRDCPVARSRGHGGGRTVAHAHLRWRREPVRDLRSQNDPG